MDPIIIAVYDRMAREHRCSADRILSNPELRTEYLNHTREALGDLPEEQLLHRLITLRKRQRLARSRDLAGQPTN